jgi:hypothetical protein
MSDTALALYEKACNAQAQRTEARRIRTRVRDARAETTGAASRWPFELLQNVHDAGPRAGQDRVNVAFKWDGTTLLFEHDGTPFKLQEVAALLSGGSSKEFESEDTTGRFGTGFMVTHALGYSIDILLVIDAAGQLELAKVSLDRHGDEEAILANIQGSNESIKSAVPVSTFENIPTAQLRYRVDKPLAVTEGFRNLRCTLPYLFATCPKLGDVLVEDTARHETWKGTPAVLRREANPHLSVRTVMTVAVDGTVLEDVEVFSCKASEQSRAALVVLVTGGSREHQAKLPEEGFPRLFARFPVRDTGTLPIPLIINAPFDQPQERDRVLMSDSDKSLIEEALKALPEIVLYANQSNWLHAHRLAHIDQIATLGGTAQIAEADWWNEQLAVTARTLSTLPIVKTTTHGFTPAVTRQDGKVNFHADFVLPRFSLKDSDGPSLERLWPLVTGAENVDPPEKDIAVEWNRTAEAWQRLGIKLNFLGLAELVQSVRKDVDTLDKLRIRAEPMLWIARLIDLVGQWARSHSALHSKLLEHLLPDQSHALRSAESLFLDDGIDSALKDLVEKIGPRVRSRLLTTGLADVAKANELEDFESGLKLIVTRSLGAGDLVSDAIGYLDKHVPDGSKLTAEAAPLLVSARALLAYLWEIGGAATADSARRIPLWTRSGIVVRCPKGATMMSPVAEWAAEARMFADAYPPQRVLDDLYAAAEDRTSLGPAFSAWQLSVGSLLIEETPADLRGSRLASLVVDGQSTSGLSVSDARFSQIAQLPSELIPRAAADKNHAKLLLGLVLCHIALSDTAWRENQDIIARRDAKDVPCRVRRSLWLGDLLYRAWLPATGEDGKAISVTASAAAIRPLLESSWLTSNDAAIELLVAHFGCNPLELRITAAAGDSAARAKLEEELATLVQLAGTDAGVYAKLAEELVARKKSQEDVNRNRTLGLAVQDVVRQCMENRGFILELIDHGYDYDVKLPDGDPLLDGAYRFQIGPWMMEVKATTSGDVRMTPSQAQRASIDSDKYLLCVVDLRGTSDEERRGPWTTDNVEPRAWIYPHVGGSVAPTWELVEQAVDSVVGIRNEKVLRYSVPPSVWERGLRLKDWVDSVKDSRTQ